jgi:hypothetical protein
MSRNLCIFFLMVSAFLLAVTDGGYGKLQETSEVMRREEFRVVDKDGRTVSNFTVLPSDREKLGNKLLSHIAKNLPSYIACLFAFASLLYSIIMNVRARRRTLLSERPALALEHTECSYVSISAGRGGGGVMNFVGFFRNAGSEALEHSRIRFAAMPLNNPDMLEEISDNRTTGTIHPNQEFASVSHL